ncbi:hypothetical protein ABZ419_29330 [Streptomyces cinnamoneus]|uniref:hypothetical protein n=1 Tax=Streptomyces cinnamoneus TaxID=53446 RepID=UPI0033D0BC66
MRKSFAVAAASAVAGLTLLAGTPANAAPANPAPAAATATVPDCVKADFWTPFFKGVEVTMENKCTTVQRVKPTFNIDMANVPCFALQPGQKEKFYRDVIFASGYKFAGLVSC